MIGNIRNQSVKTNLIQLILIIFILFAQACSPEIVPEECGDPEDSPTLKSLLDEYPPEKYLVGYSIVSKTSYNDTDSKRSEREARASLSRSIKTHITDSIRIIIRRRIGKYSDSEQIYKVTAHTLATSEMDQYGVNVKSKSDDCYRYTVAYLLLKTSIKYHKSEVEKSTTSIEKSMMGPDNGFQVRLKKKKIILALQSLATAYTHALNREKHLNKISLFESLGMIKSDTPDLFNIERSFDELDALEAGNKIDPELEKKYYSLDYIWNETTDLIGSIKIRKIDGDSQTALRGQRYLRPIVVKTYYADEDTTFPLSGARIEINIALGIAEYTQPAESDFKGLTSSKITAGENSADDLFIECSIDFEKTAGLKHDYYDKIITRQIVQFELNIEGIPTVEEATRILARGFGERENSKNVKYFHNGFKFEHPVLKEAGTFSKRFTRSFKKALYDMEKNIIEVLDSTKAHLHFMGSYDYKEDISLMEIHISALKLSDQSIVYYNTVTVNTDDAKKFGHYTSTIKIDPPIRNQTIQEGDTFNLINLNNHVRSFSVTSDQVAWQVSGGNNLIPDLQPNNVVRISIPIGWHGSEVLSIIAILPGDVTARDEAIFTIKKRPTIPCNGPSISNIPPQRTNSGGEFSDIILNNFVQDRNTAKKDLIWNVERSNRLYAELNNFDGVWRASIINTGGYWTGSEDLTISVSDPDCPGKDFKRVTFTFEPAISDCSPPQWVINFADDLGLDTRSEFVKGTCKIVYRSDEERSSFANLKNYHPNNIGNYTPEYYLWRNFGHSNYPTSPARGFTDAVADWIKRYH